MAFEIRENSGWINRNLRKDDELDNGNTKAESWADFQGTINVEGKEYQISLWEKTTAKGDDAFSVAIKEPYSPEKEDEGRYKSRRKPRR